jgi:hypothetical protein
MYYPLSPYYESGMRIFPPPLPQRTEARGFARLFAKLPLCRSEECPRQILWRLLAGNSFGN